MCPVCVCQRVKYMLDKHCSVMNYNAAVHESSMVMNQQHILN